MTLILPNNTQRVAVIGRTGGGKTVFGAWLLSEAAFTEQPYLIIDYKHDELIGDIRHCREIAVGTVPRHPGLYVTRPSPGDDKGIETLLNRIYDRERVGIFIDETTEIPNPYQRGAIRRLFVQGRSKRVPIIACTQRPSGVSPYLFSEADFFALFPLNSDADIDRCASYGTPWNKRDFRVPIPPHYCRWYDVKQDFGCLLSPCPSPDDILQRFEDRLKPRRRFL